MTDDLGTRWSDVDTPPTIDFRSFGISDKRRLVERRRALANAEFESNKNELERFSQSFKLNKPIPDDLLTILAKDEQKQMDIKKKSLEDANSAFSRVIRPSITKSESAAAIFQPPVLKTAVGVAGVQLPAPEADAVAAETQPPTREPAAVAAKVQLPIRKPAAVAAEVQLSDRKAAAVAAKVQLPTRKPAAIAAEVQLPDRKAAAVAAEVQLPTRKPAAVASKVQLPAPKLAAAAAKVQLPAPKAAAVATVEVQLPPTLKVAAVTTEIQLPALNAAADAAEFKEKGVGTSASTSTSVATRMNINASEMIQSAGFETFSPCIHVKARLVFDTHRPLLYKSYVHPYERTQAESEYDEPLVEKYMPWESSHYSQCECPWRVLLDRYNIYALSSDVNGPLEVLGAIKEWFDLPETTQLHWLNSEETKLLLSIIEHIITVVEPMIRECREARTQHSLCLSWMRKIARRTGVFPTSLTLRDVRKVEKYPAYCGGFADVYKGIYQGNPVALKVIRVTTTMATMAKSQRKVLREALHWKHLRHGNIHPFLGITQDSLAPLLGLVSPWMSNGNVLQYLENNPQADRENLLVQSTKGLSYIHDQVLVHGDVKAANILVDNDGNARLTDFGLTTISESQRIQTTYMMGNSGSPRWMAPELMDPYQEEETRNFPSDVYAFGMTITEFFTGSPPFSNEYKNDLQVIAAVMSGRRPTRPNNASLSSPLSDRLWGVAKRCWVPDPRSRPSAKKLLSDLQTTESW